MLQHIISAKDFDAPILLKFISECERFESQNHPFFLWTKPKILATLFFEPSTRTRLSFESAMIKIGGRCLGFADDKSTSTQKGESVYDTIRTTEGFADVILIRHPIDGTARLAAEATKLSTPIINGGDGSNAHPTQMLTDIYTIYKKLGRLDNIKIGYMGDLKYGRTVHSLVQALSHFDNVEHHFIPPDEELQIEPDHIECLKDQNVNFVKNSSVEAAIESLDVLYVTRLQKERFPDPMEYNRIMKNYQITPKTLSKTKPEFIVMHPLPRNEEIRRDVDDLPCSHYFQQAHNGVFARKALLYKLLAYGCL